MSARRVGNRAILGLCPEDGNIEKWHKVISDGGGGQRRKGSNSHDIIIIGFDRAVLEVKKKRSILLLADLYLCRCVF